MRPTARGGGWAKKVITQVRAVITKTQVRGRRTGRRKGSRKPDIMQVKRCTVTVTVARVERGKAKRKECFCRVKCGRWCSEGC